MLGQSDYSPNGQRQLTRYWLWLDGMPLAQAELNFSQGQASGFQLVYLHPDHLNTPRLATVNQAVVWTWSIDAYGNGQPNEDVDGDGVATPVPLRFPGQIYDAQTQASYNYFRDYDANLGRYVQSDPIGLEGGLNTYGYVNGNPIGLKDPRGLWSFGVEAYVGVGGGVSISYSQGTLEVLGRLGVGLGGDVGWNPYGGPRILCPAEMGTLHEPAPKWELVPMLVHSVAAYPVHLQAVTPLWIRRGEVFLILMWKQRAKSRLKMV